jgi:hypothetical protein
MRNFLCDGNCPQCGGLPTNPRQVNLGDAEAFTRREAPTVFTFSGERRLDWRLEADLEANRVTCSDCGLEYVHTAERAEAPAIAA